MEKTAKEFLDYLCYIGLVTDDCIHFFLNNLNSNVNSSEKIKEILINTIFSFLKEIPENNIHSISIKLVNKFFEHKIKANNNVIKNLIDLYEKFHTKIKKFYYNIWFLNTFNYDMNKLIKFNKKNDIDLNIENYKTFSYKNPINNSSHSNLRQNFYMNTHQNLIKKKKRSKSNNTSRTILQDFMIRQDEFNKYKKRNKEKLIKQNEDEFSKYCTFSPHIKRKSFEKNYSLTTNQNNYSSDPNNNIYQKLYDDSNRRLIIRNQKMVDYVKRIKSESNFATQNGLSSSKKGIDRNKIEKLYNDYKQKLNKRKELTDKYYKEEGITFKPYISKKK